MKLFLDTSSLFKLYFQESGSDQIESIFASQEVTVVFLSKLTRIEFSSIVWRRLRMQEITEPQARILIEAFKNDFDKYHFIEMDTFVTGQAEKLLMKYGSQGLRALDSIQLATAVLLQGKADLFLTADAFLDLLMKREGLPTELPNP